MTSTQAMLLRRLGGRPLLPALLLRRRPTRPRAGVVALAVALIVAVLALRLAVTSSDPVLADHLSRAREAQRLLLDLAPEGALAIDLDGRVTIANSAAEELFGYGRDGLVGLPVDQLVPGFFGALERSVREGTTPEDAAAITACSKDGRLACVRATVEALASDAGVPLVRLSRAQARPEVMVPFRGVRI